MSARCIVCRLEASNDKSQVQVYNAFLLGAAFGLRGIAREQITCDHHRNLFNELQPVAEGIADKAEAIRASSSHQRKE